MDYERIEKIEGSVSPSKLRLKLLCVQKKRKEEEEEAETVSSSITNEISELDDRGTSSSSNCKDVRVVDPETATSMLNHVSGLDSNLMVRGILPPKDQAEPRTLNGLNPYRSFEDGYSDYDGGYDNGIMSSFDCQKSSQHKFILAPFSKPTPSKWDDAGKWIPNAENQVRNKPKSGNVQAQGAPSLVPKKSGFTHGNRQSGIPNGTSMKVVTEVADRKSYAGEEVDTKRINPSQAKKETTVQKFSFASAGSYPLQKSTGWATESYPSPDDFADSYAKSAIVTEVPVSDSAINLSRHDSTISVHSSTTLIPPPTTVRSVSMRDMGTEMTPIASEKPSRTGTPVRATTPTRSPASSHPSTPGRAGHASSPANPASGISNCVAGFSKDELSEKELQMKTRREIAALGAQLGKLNIAAWASKEEEDKDASTSLKTNNVERRPANVIEARAVAWEEAEKAKLMARYKREEIKIQAWENHQKAKAEAEMRKTEVEIERMKGYAHEKLMNKLASARHKAEERRAAAEARRNQQAAKAAQQAEYIRRTGRIPSAFTCCGWCS